MQTQTPVYGLVKDDGDVFYSVEVASGNMDKIEAALLEKADKDSPVLTGAPKAPTVDSSDSSTNIATTAYVRALYNSISPNDIEARREILDIKLKLDELNVTEFLNKTGIGFFDLFEDNSYVDTAATTAAVSGTDVTFAGAKILKMVKQTFADFSDVELAIYDLARTLFKVDVAVTNSSTINMSITPGSRTAGEKFYYNGEIYTILSVTG